MDSVEWRAEIERVYHQLVEIERDMEICRGTDTGMGEDIEECRRHVDCIVEMCGDIKMSAGPEVRKVFQRAGECLSSDLQDIREAERRINRQNES